MKLISRKSQSQYNFLKKFYKMVFILITIGLSVFSIFNECWSKWGKEKQYIIFEQPGLTPLYKFSSTDNLHTIKFFEGKKFLVCDGKTLKIYSLTTGDLIKSLSFNDEVIKSFYSTDSKFLFVLTRYRFFVLNGTNFQVLSSFKGNRFKDMDLKNNYVALLDEGKDRIIVYTLKGEKVSDFNLGSYLNYLIKLSLDSAKIAVFSQRGFPYYLNIYNIKEGTLENKNKFLKIKDFDWINSRKLYYISQDELGIFDSKVGSKLFFYKFKEKGHVKFDFIEKVSENKFIVGNSKGFTILTINYQNHQGTLQKRGIAFNINENNEYIKTSDLIITSQKVLLAIAFSNGNIYIFDVTPYVRKFIENLKAPNNKNLESVNNAKGITIPKSEGNKLPIKILNINKVQEKKENKSSLNYPSIERKKENVKKLRKSKETLNKKPVLKVFVTKDSEYAPAKVTVRIICKDEDGKIIGYYISFDDREIVRAGNPNFKSFSHTFYEPGTHEIFVGIKDDKGAIVFKRIKIYLKKMTFEEFKKFN